MSDLAFADDLIKLACKCCATIARAKVQNWWKRKFIPAPNDPTATVTFVAFDGRTYAVTAWHVIEIFKEAALSEGIRHPEGYFLPAKPGVGIGPPFVRAPTARPR